MNNGTTDKPMATSENNATIRSTKKGGLHPVDNSVTSPWRNEPTGQAESEHQGDYTPPPGNDVTLKPEGGYTSPKGDEVNLELGGKK